MNDKRALLSVEADGLRRLQSEMRLTGIVVKSIGESFEYMCLRIANEYDIPVHVARKELEHFE